MGLDLVEDAVLDGVAGRVEERVGHLDKLVVHLLLLVHVHAHHAFVDSEQVDDWMVLVHKDVGTSGDLDGVYT